MECQYCNNSFKNKSSFTRHQKSAKYCLKIRNKSETMSKCVCEAIFSSEGILDKHHYTCIIYNKQQEKKYQKDINFLKHENDLVKSELLRVREQLQQAKEQLEQKEIQVQKLLEQKDKQIYNLQESLKSVAIHAIDHPTTNTTNTTNNHTIKIDNYIQQLEVVTDEHFKEQSQYLTMDHILKGPDGYAEFALEYPLKNRIVCVDYARRKVKFKNKDGNVVVDPDMGVLATKLFRSIRDRNQSLIMSYTDKLKDRFAEEADFMLKLLSHHISVRDGAEGEKTNFYGSVVKTMCGKRVP